MRRSHVGYAADLAEPFAALFPARSAPRGKRIPIAKAHELLAQAAKQSGNAALGLHAGRAVSLGSAGALDYAMHAAPTLEEALLTAARFIALVNGQLTIQLETARARSGLWFESSQLRSALAEDFLLSAMYKNHVRRLLPAAARVECFLTQKRPRDIVEHRRALPKAQLTFSAPRAGFMFDSAYLRRPLARAEPRLFRILVDYLERDLREMPEALTIAGATYKLLMSETPIQSSTASTAASKLGLSSRTLARHLNREGTSFAEVLEQVRVVRGKALLEQDSASIDRIAATLGFSQDTAFHRAFKRWTAQTPGEYRAAQQRRGA